MLTGTFSTEGMLTDRAWSMGWAAAGFPADAEEAAVSVENAGDKEIAGEQRIRKEPDVTPHRIKNLSPVVRRWTFGRARSGRDVLYAVELQRRMKYGKRQM